MLYAGWDGGGTKTEVCILDASGARVAGSVFGPLNPNGTDRDRVMETVRQAVAWMAEQGGGLSAFGGLTVGMAGVSNREAAEWLMQALRRAGWTGPCRLAGDQEIALAGAIRGHGAVLIAGTGAVLCGRDPQGRMFRVGGYGYLIDDGGSGYAIGRDILAAVVRAEDGRDRPTGLTSLVMETLGAAEIRELITWLYAPATGKKEVASLARLLAPALEQGDSAAERIAEKAAADLAELALAGWRKTGIRDGELALTGSILQHFDRIARLVTERVQACYPEIRVVWPEQPPAVGAARLAMNFGKTEI